MPIPVNDLVTLITTNRQERVKELTEQVDAKIAKMFSFPITIGFDKREDREVLKELSIIFQIAGYNVLLTVASSDKHGFILAINHGTPYTNAIGSHALFAC